MQHEIRAYPVPNDDQQIRAETAALFTIVIFLFLAWTAASVAFGVWLGGGAS